MAERSKKPAQRARGELSFRLSLRGICIAATLLGAGALLSGCEQPVTAQTLPVMDAGTFATDAEDPDNTLPNLDTPDIRSPDFNVEDIGGSDFEFQNVNPPPTGTPNLEPPTLQPNTPGTLEPTQPETQNTPQTPAETPDSKTRPATTRGSGENTPPDYMIRRHPKHA